MLVISLATTGTVITTHIHKQGDYRKPLPRIVKIIFFNWIAKIFLVKIHIRNRETKMVEMQALLEMKNSTDTDVRRYTSSQTIKKVKQDSIQLKKRRDNNVSWSPLINNVSHYNNVEYLNSSQQVNASEKQFLKLVKHLNKNLADNELKDDLEDYYEEIKSEWAQLAQVIDTLFAFAFITFTATIMFIFIYFYIIY